MLPPTSPRRSRYIAPMPRLPSTTATLILGLTAPLTAQVPYQGNGVGAAYVAVTTATVGGTLDLEFGSPNLSNGLVAFCSSDGYGPVNFPNVGSVWLDYTSAEFYYSFFTTNAAGEQGASLPVPAVPALLAATPLFAACVAFEPVGISISKTARIDFEVATAFRPVGAMAAARALQTVTALGASPRDNETRVLIAGGGGGTVLQPLATDSTELYVPLMRGFVPGPTMAVERTLHQAVRLADGRVLLCGGADSNGNVTATCELFDPATAMLAATGSMGSPRAGHAATLLANGRVLVTGGLSDYVDPINNFLAVMNTAQATAELYDPATGMWTPVPGAMTDPRSGHTQTLLPNGALLIAGGIRGATLSTLLASPVPIYTATVDRYDPVTNTFTPTGSMLFGRAFHGASVLANGDVLVTGGSLSDLFFGTVFTTGGCERWNGSTWSGTAPLPQGLTNHVQVRAANGDALVFGGFTGSFPTLTAVDLSGRHDGATYTAGPLLGANPALPAGPTSPRGAAAAAWLGDGTLLLVGGADDVGPLVATLVYHD